MADPLVVLVLLASTGRPDPIGSAMTLAARQALGRDAVVLVDERLAFPPLDEAESLGKRARAAAVVEVEWRDATHTHVTVRVHDEHDKSWRERDIAFRSGDPPDECGRTIGFAMASLIERSDDAPTASATAPTPEPVPASPERPPPPVTDPPYRGMVEAAGVATLGGGDGTTTGGGELAGFWLLLPRLALGVTGGARFGDLTPARASIASALLGAGGAWRMAVFPTFELDLRADALGMLLVVTHDGATQSSWLPAARVGVEAAWFPLIPSLGLVAMGGAEAAFGSAFVVVGDHTVATVPPFRALGEVGLRARF